MNKNKILVRYMNGKTLFIMVLLLTAFLYPVIVNAAFNIVLPAVSHVKNVILNIGAQILGGGGGDELPGDWHPT